MRFEIELFSPVVARGAEAHTTSLGPCRVITQPLFVTLTEHDGQAKAIPLETIREVDLTLTRCTTVLGTVARPRRIDFPERFFVETATGHAVAVNGDLIARMVRTRRQGEPANRVRW
jgi:hypothetical protein